jgi:hypothetical protein
MKRLKIIGANLFFFLLFCNIVGAQPIPIELMTGDKYGTVNLAFSRNFSQTSKCCSNLFFISEIKVSVVAFMLTVCNTFGE